VASTQGQLAGSVAAGIIVARLLGFVRERVFAHYFGNSPAADAFRAALKIPNVIRNLLGEGTLAASFVPVYAGLLARGEKEEARRLASTMANILVLITAASALLGIVLAPIITDFAAPGFSGTTRELTERLVGILFPMSGVMILSAWCLGILNTHGRFFLSYAAAGMWNVAQIGVLVALGGYLMGARLVTALAWGALAGSLLQVAVQLPTALKLVGQLRWELSLRLASVRRVIRNWGPVVVGAGVVQISSIVDTQLASLLGGGAVAMLGYAQLLATLPLSLFGVSIAAVALPELSREATSEARNQLATRVSESLRRLGFYIIPSAFGLASLGSWLVAALFQTGQFGPTDTELVAGVVAAYAIGLPAQASVKLLASGHYALGDTKTPVRIAAASVFVSATLAFVLMQWLGVAGIALGSGLGAYLNLGLNYATLERKAGRLWGAAQRRDLCVTGLGAVLASGGGLMAGSYFSSPWAGAVASSAGFGLVFGAVTLAAGHPDAKALVRRFKLRSARG
jgi:putative peptidoglycan lipid II flippase